MKTIIEKNQINCDHTIDNTIVSKTRSMMNKINFGECDQTKISAEML